MARRRQKRRVELVVGSEDFETPARVMYAEVYSDEQADRALVLAAGVEKLQPIRWLYI